MTIPLLNEYSDLLSSLLDSAAQQGVYLIARLQQVESRGLTVNNGKAENVEASLTQGIGMQLFDRDGHTAFAATDRLTRESAELALRTAIVSLRAAAQAGLQQNPAIFDVQPVQAVEVPSTPYGLDDLALDEVLGLVETINHELSTAGAGLKVRSQFHADREQWRIVRSDGTDVSYMLPHGYCYNAVSAQRNGKAHTLITSLARTGYEVLREDRAVLLRRAHSAAETVQGLADAPRYPAGAYPIIMDYAMAKGLAHEAVGHSSETDTLGTSILGKRGFFRRGERLAADSVTIIDESLVGDHAWQPFSPHGLRRSPAVIIQHGVLQDGIADLFSAQATGTRIIDASRVQSYSAIPAPRMSNIRIELPEPYPLAGQFEDQTPETVRESLINAGLLQSGRPVIYLSGYKGGQVNPSRGHFVFNCAALWELSVEGVKLYQPAIFSGEMQAALQAIAAGFGPLQLDAMGFCGKAGQSIPSSGGSHYFLYLEPSPLVRIGGK
jgi:TldD protein